MRVPLFVIVAVCLHSASTQLETMGEEVKENAVEEALDDGLTDLMKSISSIHDHLRNITNPKLENWTNLIDKELKNGMDVVTKDITYDNLIDRIKQAKSKIKEIQDKVSSTMTDLEKNWPETKITRQDDDEKGDEKSDSGDTEDEEFVSVSS